jgi:Patatin-like phospholipase
MSLRLLGAFLLGCLLLSACAGVPRRGAPAGPDASAIVPGFPAEIRWIASTRHDVERRSPVLLRQVQRAADGGPVNVLVLSGGGAGGAFGAGALVGLSRRGTRPDFQIVTGVSAGALIAPLAFLGQDWDLQLAEAFSGAPTQHLMHARWLGALFGDSVYRGEPLAQLVDRYVTDELLRAVARESQKGRLLVVATTDLDSEQTVFWNLGLIAEQGGARAKRLFRDVLIASASIPGVFPPVMIHVEEAGKTFEEMHVDGSAMASLFFIPDIAAILPNPLEPLRDGHLYLLINGPLRTAEATTRDQTFSILKRSAVAALQGGTRSAIEIAYAVAQRHRMSIAVTDIPDVYPFGGALEFDMSKMRALFDYGEHCALADELWSTPIDALDQPPIPAGLSGPQAVQCAGAELETPPLESASIQRHLPEPLDPASRTGANGDGRGGDPNLATISKEVDPAPSDARTQHLAQSDIEPRAR